MGLTVMRAKTVSAVMFFLAACAIGAVLLPSPGMHAMGRTVFRRLHTIVYSARHKNSIPAYASTGALQSENRNSAASSACSPMGPNPVYYGCFTGNSPYRHTVASLLAAGATVHADRTAVNYWNNGNPLTANNINADGESATTMWIASPNDPSYVVTCPVYKPGYCNAATSRTGVKVHIPPNASPTTDSDHHIFIFDPASAQEVDMWGGGGDGNGGPTTTLEGVTTPVACQVGTAILGQLSCSWGGVFPFRGNGLASAPGNSGVAGGVAYGMVAITAGDILSGHVRHALGMIGPCLDNSGQYPSTRGRSTDSVCVHNASGHVDGAEPTLRYGDMIHLKSTVNLAAAPYSAYSSYCRVVLKALQEYGAYADDNSSGYGLHLIAVGQSDPGWQAIMASMIRAGDASGDSASAHWNSCLNRVTAGDVETITLNQGDRTIPDGGAMLPPLTSP